MSEISELLKQKYSDDISGDLPSAKIAALDGKLFYWKPLTGHTQKIIQSFAEKSTAEGICMHVKSRALDSDGKPIFDKETTVVDMMNNYDFEMISAMFFSITNLDLSMEDIEKN